VQVLVVNAGSSSVKPCLIGDDDAGLLERELDHRASVDPG
jgi:acetate kinase